LDPSVSASAGSTVDAAGALLVAGTTLSTLSSLRLVRAAVARGAPVLILNRGATRADGLSGVDKFEADVGEALTLAATDLKNDLG
jgi:hypothetical protein